MRSMYKPNISPAARMVSTIAGAALAAFGYRRSNRMLGALGVGLIARGASGWCPVTAATDLGAYDYGDPYRENATKRHLAGSRGVIVEDAIRINRPIDEVYAYWRNLENLPRFMEHLEEVRETDRFRSRWTARGPLGVKVDWDAEIINDIPPTLLSWKSIGDSDVVHAGSVRFRPVGANATELRVKLQYDPPAGKVGDTVARFFGEDAQQEIAEDLRRFKGIIESGAEVASGRSGPGESGQRMGRGLDPSDLSSDFGSLR